MMENDEATLGVIPPPLPPTLPPPVRIRPAPPRVWTSFVLFALVMATMLMFSGTPLLLILLLEEGFEVFTSPQLMVKMVSLLGTPMGLILVAVTNVTILSAATFVAAFLSPVPLRRRLEMAPSPVSLVTVLMMAVGGVAVSWWLSFAVTAVGLFDPEDGGVLVLMNKAFQESRGLTLLAMIGAIGVLVPVAEELLFRGYIQSRLTARLGAVVAVGITSLLFGLMHMDLLHSPLAAVMGAYLGYVALRGGSVWPAVVVHAAINVAAVLGAQVAPEELEESAIYAILAALSVVVVVATVFVHVATRRSGG